MSAIVKTALSDKRTHFREIMNEINCFQVLQAEFLQSGRIDEMAVLIEMV